MIISFLSGVFGGIFFLTSNIATNEYFNKYEIYSFKSKGPYITEKTEKYLHKNIDKFSPSELYARLKISILIKLSDRDSFNNSTIYEKNSQLLKNHQQIKKKFPRLRKNFGFLQDLKIVYLDSGNYKKYNSIYNSILKIHSQKLKTDLECYKFSHFIFLKESKFESLENQYKKCEKSNSIKYMKAQAATQYAVLKINKKPFISNLAYQKSYLEYLKN